MKRPVPFASPDRFPPVAAWAVALSFAALVLVAACRRNDRIERYTVEKPAAPEAAEEERPARAEPPAGLDRPAAPPESSLRLLGAIVPHGSRCWFFKAIGPAHALTPHADKFIALVRSIRFDEDRPDDGPTWDLPEGWREEPGDGMRRATIKLDPDDPTLEVSVIPLAMRDADVDAYVLSNVNRWRRQVGRPEIEAGRLAGDTTRVDLDGATATVVDLVGAAAPDAGPRMPMGVNAGGRDGR